MAFDEASVRKHVKAFNFTELFREIGWNLCNTALPVEVAGHTYTLHSPSNKAGLQVFVCPANAGGGMPDYATRRRIERGVSKSYAEHLIIFVDAAKTTQIWQWIKKQKDRPYQSREHTCFVSQPGPLVQKLQKLQFTFEEELALEESGGVTISHSTRKRDSAFDVEKVTKKFFKAFETEHRAFLDKIVGFPPPVGNDPKTKKPIPHGDLQWYASLTLNRLMFVYFIQKKRFLDGDADYLQNRLGSVKQLKGDGRFRSFYRLFLLHLFHEGLGKQEAERDADLAQLIGKVPYLNGGFFEVHQLERDYPGIDIPDKAFKRLFDFFDGWDWVLDTRMPRDLTNPHERKDEINPDVVGYIFEKFVNQKQMGAYYTKEDITGYITHNTVLPFLLDRAAKECAVAFQPGGPVWRLLKDDPDRYLHEPVRRGVLDAAGNVIPLPPEIEAGIADIPKRAGWNKPAAAPFALPTESWREHVARRQRCLELRDQLKNGAIHTVNGLITHNLDIRQFAQDIVTQCDGPDLLRALWQPLRDVTVLDPTCGSGAFLFAALTLLEPLYSGCLDKMRAFLDEAERLNDFKRLARLDDFAKVLKDIARHANADYFVLKTIIVNNLYGVDVMEEAVEICRLRLFLKLVATIDDPRHIEPLPDIDFNIRAGNTLVGYATRAQAQDNLNFGNALERVEAKAKVMGQNWQSFKTVQNEVGYGSAFVGGMKDDIKKPLGELREELDSLLAVTYGQAGTDKLPAFRKSHQPFHWCVEFYDIVTNRGGFDVIVGNPPYVEYKDIVGQYSLRSYRTQQCGNLFAFVIERTIDLSHRVSRIGMIVPLSAFSTDRMTSLISEIDRSAQETHLLNFSWRPGKLFDGVNLQLSIALIERGERSQKTWTTQYLLWDSEARDTLFSKVQFAAMRDRRLSGSIPKLGSPISSALLDKLRARGGELSMSLDRRGEDLVYYRRGGLYWKVFVDFKTGSSEEKELRLKAGTNRYAIIAALSSNLWFWYFTATSDCRHLGNRDIDSFPFDPMSLDKADLRILADLGSEYVRDLKKHVTRRVRVYKKVSEVEVLSFMVKRSKDIVDRIDAHIATATGLSAAELDFIQNIDIKYRLGDDDSDD